jgi:hypothetical protein
MVTPNYIFWRRETLKDKKGNTAVFNMEASPSVEEAFVAQGQSVFPPQAIEFYLNSGYITAGRKGKLVVPPHDEGTPPKPIFMDDPKGILTIWEWPKSDVTYCIGTDASMGQRGAEDQESSGKEYQTSSDADSKTTNDACAAICMSEDYRQVAELETYMIDPESFAEEVAALGWYYGGEKNPAWVMPEVGCQGAGIAMAYHLRDIYSRICLWEKLDSPRQKKVKSLGWEASIKSKGIMLGKVVRKVLHATGLLTTTVSPQLKNEAKLIIRSRRLLAQMSNFATLKSGAFGGRHGSKDDLAIALCLTLIALKDIRKKAYICPKNKAAAEKQMKARGVEDPMLPLNERSWLEL